MPAKIYKVTLTTEERTKLTAIVSKGKGNARRMRRAQILLLADENQPDGGWKDAGIAQALQAHPRTVERTREKCVSDCACQLALVTQLAMRSPSSGCIHGEASVIPEGASPPTGIVCIIQLRTRIGAY